MFNTLQCGANLTVVGSKKWTDEQREEWLKNAPASIPVTVNGQNLIAKKKEYSTGSVGYYANGKAVLQVSEKAA